jgi:hypothetical protein
MADDDKTEAGAAAPVRSTQRDQAAASADEATVQRPIPTPRTLTRTELEALRSRLQRKFH